MNIPQPPSNFKLLPTQDYNPVYVDQPNEEQIDRNNRIKNRETGQLFRIVFLSTLFFILLSQQFVYKISHNILQYLMSTPISTMNSEGCPTTKGILVHGVIFFIIMLFVVC